MSERGLVIARVALIIGQAVAVGFMIAGLATIAGGCGVYQREWAKVPPGALEKCQAAADEVARLQDRPSHGDGLLWCDEHECTCHITTEPLTRLRP